MMIKNKIENYKYDETLFESDGAYEYLSDIVYAREILEAYRQEQEEELCKLQKMTNKKYKNDFYKKVERTTEEKEEIYREFRLTSAAHNTFLRNKLENPAKSVCEHVINANLLFKADTSKK